MWVKEREMEAREWTGISYGGSCKIYNSHQRPHPFLQRKRTQEMLGLWHVFDKLGSFGVTFMRYVICVVV